MATFAAVYKKLLTVQHLGYVTFIPILSYMTWLTLTYGMC
uniref:Uncharacterized protein n=1 Tax=Anguilla anguilla TaxID=7936 RepID=A0A0E9PTK4_ANGAN